MVVTSTLKQVLILFLLNRVIFSQNTWSYRRNFLEYFIRRDKYFKNFSKKFFLKNFLLLIIKIIFLRFSPVPQKDFLKKNIFFDPLCGVIIKKNFLRDLIGENLLNTNHTP
jgi:hypothetical protein